MLAVLAFGPASHSAFAQRGSGGGMGGQPGLGASQPLNPTTPNMPIFNVMRGGEIQIDVNLWGFVGSPGHYRVPGSTSLVELLSFAGGPTAQARLVDIRVVHADTAAQQRVQIYNLEAYRDDGDLSQNPAPRTGRYHHRQRPCARCVLSGDRHHYECHGHHHRADQFHFVHTEIAPRINFAALEECCITSWPLTARRTYLHLLCLAVLAGCNRGIEPGVLRFSNFWSEPTRAGGDGFADRRFPS